MLGRAIEQFLGDVLWGSPDYLLIDLPPGTGDIALTVAQMIPGAELIIVTTPQEAAARTAVKAAKMAQMTKQRVLGVVENMSYFVCPDCGSRHYIFGRGGAFEIARLMDTRLLGRIPLDEATREGGDHGRAGRPRPLDARRRRLRGHRQGRRGRDCHAGRRRRRETTGEPTRPDRHTAASYYLRSFATGEMSHPLRDRCMPMMRRMEVGDHRRIGRRGLAWRHVRR